MTNGASSRLRGRQVPMRAWILSVTSGKVGVRSQRAPNNLKLWSPFSAVSKGRCTKQSRHRIAFTFYNGVA